MIRCNVIFIVEAVTDHIQLPLPGHMYIKINTYGVNKTTDKGRLSLVSSAIVAVDKAEHLGIGDVVGKHAPVAHIMWPTSVFITEEHVAMHMRAKELLSRIPDAMYTWGMGFNYEHNHVLEEL